MGRGKQCRTLGPLGQCCAVGLAVVMCVFCVCTVLRLPAAGATEHPECGQYDCKMDFLIQCKFKYSCVARAYCVGQTNFLLRYSQKSFEIHALS